MNDTDERSEARYFELLRSRSAVERLEMAVRLSSSVRELCEMGVRNASPTLSERDVRARVAERVYGSAVANRLFPGALLRDG